LQALLFPWRACFVFKVFFKKDCSGREEFFIKDITRHPNGDELGRKGFSLALFGGRKWVVGAEFPV
jgi:hypothetical protein